MKDGWELKKLKDICLIRPNKKLAKEQLSDDELVSFVPMQYLPTGEKYFTSPEVKTLGKAYPGYVYFEEEDVVLAKITPCFENGKLGIARNLKNKIGFGSSEFIVYRCLDNIIPEYLFYFLSQESFRSAGEAVMRGAVGHKRIPKEFYEDSILPIPPLPEQKAIVRILDQAFAAIDQAQANIQRNIENAEELFQSKLEEIFSERGEGSANGVDRWEEKKLGEVCEGFQYGSSSKSNLIGTVPVLRMGNIQNGEIIWDKLKYSDDPEEIKKYTLNPGDVLFNRTNSPELVGKTAIFNGERETIFAGYLIRIRGKEGIINNQYLNFFLNSPKARNYGFNVMSSSVNQANINATKLKSYQILFPDISTQKRIVAIMEKLQNECSEATKLYIQKLELLEKFKSSLLNKAFSGELTAKATEALIPKNT